MNYSGKIIIYDFDGTYLEFIEAGGYKLSDDSFCLGYDRVVYNDGVIEFLDMLCKNGVDNYLINSGIKVFLDKVSISRFFLLIFMLLHLIMMKIMWLRD